MYIAQSEKRIFIKECFYFIFLIFSIPSFAQKGKKLQIIESASPLVSELNHKVAYDYIKLTNQLIMRNSISPANAARIHAYTGITLYESLVKDMPKYNSMASQLDGFEMLPQKKNTENYYWEVVADESLHLILDSLFSYSYSILGVSNFVRAELDTLHNSNQKLFKKKYVNAIIYKASVNYAQDLAAKIYQIAKTDGGYRIDIEDVVQKDYVHYVSPKGSTWDDNKLKQGISIQPTWGKNRTLVRNIHSYTKPVPPIPFSLEKDSDYYKQANEIYLMSRELTFEQSVIAEYWRDEINISYTPPGHTIDILLRILQKENTKLDRLAYCYAKVGIALNDAFICCWATKYETHCMRPVTYIQENIDKLFKPTFLTPPFPEYTSGHSTQWGAASEVLGSLFGYGYYFTDEPDYLKGKMLPRSYQSFEQVALEASASRMYAGIHYRQACEAGYRTGKQIGQGVNDLKWMK
jgi:hypothetical protein